VAEICHLENRHDVIFFCWGWSDFNKILQTNAEWHVDCGDVVKIETRCRIPIWPMFGRIPWHVIPEPPATLQSAATWRMQCHDSWYQSYVSHCRVLPLGEFTVTIPEPHATLQSAVIWWNQCHDRATLQGVIIPSVIIENRFSPYCILFYFFFKCSLSFDERRLSYRLRYTCFEHHWH